MEFSTVSNAEIVSLETILVKNNKQVVGVRFEPGSSGVGGSNTSGFCADEGAAFEYTVEELNGRKPLYIERSELCALVNDVLYFRHKGYNGEMRTFTLDCTEKSFIARGKEIAYDTISATRVVLLLKQD